ncbi:MFS transporter, partial [Bacillus anthracis]|nr:MFS transporter [Bacillus anthracis]MZF01272.1 MFS transporter [Bacillus anthracis]MZF44017.1 MFS transporter [Bacillus anthracis]
MDILKNRNFLLLFLGRIFTNIGDSLYYVAAMWLVYKLSGNPFYSGLAG